MAGFFGAIAVIISLLLMFAGYSWLSEKVFGVKTVSSYSRLHKANEQAAMDKIRVEKLSVVDPVGISNAIGKCNDKGYARTYTNVLTEYNKRDRLS